MSSSSYKITAKEVRKAAKKNGLEIEYGGYFINNFDGQIKCACPIAQLYMVNHNGDDLDASKCSSWGDKKFGKYFKKGFVTGFDNTPMYGFSVLKGRDRKNYLNGYRNGKKLRRYLLNK